MPGFWGRWEGAGRPGWPAGLLLPRVWGGLSPRGRGGITRCRAYGVFPTTVIECSARRAVEHGPKVSVFFFTTYRRKYRVER